MSALTDVTRTDQDGRKFNKFGEVVVDCLICSEPTNMAGTRRCDPCWELETRIRNSPARFKKVMAFLSPRPDTDAECRFHHPGA
jgi:hypothetical protein